MARRPIFVPNIESGSLVNEISVEFHWYPGMSLQQKKKSVSSLHEAASRKGVYPILEISTKSELELGRRLSAFNLLLKIGDNQRVSVEAAYQGSKVFTRGGPYRDFYGLDGKKIKTDERLRNSGDLVAFDFNGISWSLEPKTAFYDWLYVSALHQNPSLSSQILEYKGFSDIEFNPEKSINCQARAAALFVVLYKRNILEFALSSQTSFIQAILGAGASTSFKQENLL